MQHVLITPAIEKATGKATAKKKATAKPTPTDDISDIVKVEDPANETSRQYSTRLGQWRSDVLATVETEVFWFVVDIACAAHGPLQHRMGFMSKRISLEEASVKGGHVSQLVCGKGLQIFSECSACFADLSWARKVCAEAPPLARELMALGVELNCHHAASYVRRVVSYLNRSCPISGLDFCANCLTKEN